MNNHDLATKIARRVLKDYQGELREVTEEELVAAIEDEIEANGD